MQPLKRDVGVEGEKADNGMRDVGVEGGTADVAAGDEVIDVGVERGRANLAAEVVVADVGVEGVAGNRTADEDEDQSVIFFDLPLLTAFPASRTLRASYLALFSLAAVCNSANRSFTASRASPSKTSFLKRDSNPPMCLCGFKSCKLPESIVDTEVVFRFIFSPRSGQMTCITVFIAQSCRIFFLPTALLVFCVERRFLCWDVASSIVLCRNCLFTSSS